MSRTRRAFSLVEVIIAVGMLSGLIGMLFFFLGNLLGSRAVALEYADQQMAASTLIERVESDLMTSLVGDSVFGAGVSGSETSLRVLSRAVPANLAGDAGKEAAAFGDLQVSEYRFDKATKTIDGRKGPAERAGAGSIPFWPMGTSIARVRFRFHDGTAWRDSFDSLASNRLPQAVEIAVWFRPWPEDLLEGDAAAPEDEGEETDIPERLTFDSDARTFDEETFAMLSDVDLDAAPRPDRVRVIVIPDPAPGDERDADVDAGETTGEEAIP